mgnify:CR=1 FL=1
MAKISLIKFFSELTITEVELPPYAFEELHRILVSSNALKELSENIDFFSQFIYTCYTENKVQQELLKLHPSDNLQADFINFLILFDSFCTLSALLRLTYFDLLIVKSSYLLSYIDRSIILVEVKKSKKFRN